MTTQTGFEFEKESVVSAWYSTTNFSDIPDSYFEEDANGIDQWARNFLIAHYDAENMETNGSESGTLPIIDVIAPCSYSHSYAEAVKKKIEKLGDTEISWLILLFDYEYRPKKSKVFEDEYVKFVGAFPYQMDAGSIVEI
ncbi:immunity 22 family protein [Amphritea sp. HPY]|uniref:immunity 22 family protein n=1 Tax=Amphritea sp. HPY TaxID=3421652 RepID=UPI003D7EF657